MRPMSWLVLLAACAAPPAPAPPSADWAARVAHDVRVAETTIDPTSRTATFAAMGVSVGFDADGAHARGDDGALTLRLGAMVRGGERWAFTEADPEMGAAVPGLTLPDGRPTHRLEYRRDGVTEWFAGTPDGLEHGWVIDDAPPGDGPLRFELRIDAAVLEVQDDAVRLIDDGGAEWSYAGLAAWDAEGDPVATRFVAVDGGLAVELDDRGAVWPIEVDPVLTTASTTLTGPASASSFGYSVASAGDVDADGYDDVVVGAYRASALAGRAYVYHGSASGLATSATTTLTGGAGVYYCGGSVAGGGDVDADGYDDVAVACFYSAGVVKVFHGSAAGVSATATSTLTTGTAIRFGYGLAVADSVDGDSYDDVVVGAPAYSASKGRVLVYPGSAAGVSTTASTTLDGPVAASSFGNVVVGAGDIDGDGYGDVAVGAPAYSASAGRVSVYYGSASGLSSGSVDHLAGSALARVGAALAAGDVDDDGYADLLVGSDVAVGGSAWLYLGSAAGIGATATTTLTDATASRFGASLALGDVDGDGYADAAVGAYGTTAVSTFAGSASGLSTTADTTLSSTGGSFGYALATADVDGDGLADLVVGDPDDPSGYGKVYVYDGLGSGTTCAADADDDGYADLTGATVASADGDCDDAGEAASGDPATDCDDTDPAVHPGATEGPADGVDSDCDGVETCLVDADSDGWTDGAAATVVSADGDCTDAGEATTATPAGDCDDTDPALNPGASDTPADGIDQDCDGAWSCYADGDGDGFGDGKTDSPDASCSEAGEAVLGGDCDDAAAGVNPTAIEVCDAADTDEDCDGLADGVGASGGSPWFRDADGDGYGDATTTVDACETAPSGYVADASDCDDLHAAVSPAADEVCDGADNDCDSLVDDADPDVDPLLDGTTWYPDVDLDGWGETGAGVLACADPSGFGSTYVTTDGDCDDADDTAHPGASETVGDGADQDCDGGETCWVDADGDGARSTSTVASTDLDCADTGEAGDTAGNDCDDTDAAVGPGAAETVADGVDQDCDGAELCYADGDGDGVTGTGTVVSSDTDCTGVGEGTTDQGDCDDADAAVRPGALEGTGDEVDQDCDGAEACYEDADGDGYRPDSYSEVPSADTDCTDPGEARAGAPEGDCDDDDAAYNPGATESDCADPADYNCDGSTGYDDGDGDGWAACLECNDGDAAVNPDAVELAGDAIDQDCDTTELCYVDADADGHRPDATSTVASADVACTDAGEADAADPTDDCDDGAASVYPGAPEVIGNAVDEDCDGAESCYADADGDGWRDDAGTATPSADLDCDDAGEATAATATGDCNDADPAWNPGAAEGNCADPNDYNCDGSVGETDADGDGYGACDECDDSTAAVSPAATELCNGIDDDCSGEIDDHAADATTWWIDADDDGYGDRDAPISDCQQPAGTAPNADDCDDQHATVHPGATDVPADTIDQDCDGADATADTGDTGVPDTGDTGDGEVPERVGGLFGGCSTGGGAATLGAGLAAALLTRRRRRSG